MIKEKRLSEKKYYLIYVLMVFSVILMILFHIGSYGMGVVVFMAIFLFWLNYPRSLTYSLFWVLLAGGVMEVLFSRKYLGVIFIFLALIFLLGKHVLIEESFYSEDNFS